MSTAQTKKDHWSAKTYSAAASFVPKLTQKILVYLDPKPTDRILDVGCGDGKFTANYLDSVAEVYGVDASPSFIESAKQDYGGPKAHFKVVDCCFLESDQEALGGQWDKVYAANSSTKQHKLTA
jgi:ubiquinone/menaquinone biosynthesis C-methylase UbiE